MTCIQGGTTVSHRRLRPVYMEKSCPGKESYPHSRVNFIERLFEKKVHPFAQGKSWQQHSSTLWLSCLDQVDLAGRAYVSSMTIDPARRVTLLADPTFGFSCTTSSPGRFSRKKHPGDEVVSCKRIATLWKGRLVHRSSGRRVTRVPAGQVFSM